MSRPVIPAIDRDLVGVFMVSRWAYHPAPRFVHLFAAVPTRARTSEDEPPVAHDPGVDVAPRDFSGTSVHRPNVGRPMPFGAGSAPKPGGAGKPLLLK